MKKMMRVFIGAFLLLVILETNILAATTIIDDIPQISKETVVYSEEQNHLFKSGDILTISFVVNNWTLDGEVVSIYLANEESLIYNVLTGETEIISESYADWISFADVSIDGNEFTLELTLQENVANTKKINITTIAVKNGEERNWPSYGGSALDDFSYNFYVNDNCALGYHTITTSTDYTIDVMATCTQNGSKSKHCIICGQITTDTQEIIPATEHKLVKTEEEAANCIKTGNKAYWTCSICENIYADAEAIEETTVEEMTMPRTNHIFLNYISNNDAAIGKDGTKTAKCMYCDATDTIVDAGSALMENHVPDGTTGNNGNAIVGTEPNGGNGNTEEISTETTTLATIGTILEDKKNKCKIVVTSSDVNVPTVAYKKSVKSAKVIKVPDTVTVNGITYKVTSITDNAFKNNKKVTKIVIGKNVSLIGKSAFKGCKKLKNITMTAGKLKKIGKNAFKGINKKAIFKIKGKKNAKMVLARKLKSKKIGYVKTWKIR